MRRHRVWILVSVLVMTAAGTVLLTANRPWANDAPIKIAAIYNRTGGMKWLDIPGNEGFQLAAQQINAAGGILGRPLEVLERDGTTDTTKIGRIASDLAAAGDIAAIGGVNDPVFAVAPVRGATRRGDGGLISFSHSEMGVAVGLAVRESGIPFVTAGSTLSNLPDQVGEDLFMVAASHQAQAFAAADFSLQRLGAASVWILTDEGRPFATALADAFTRRWTTEGGASPTEDTYPSGKLDISVQIEKMKQSNQTPDVIFVASFPNESGYLIQQLRAAGFSQPIVVADVVDARYVAAAAGKMTAVYLATQGSLDDPSVEDFIADFSAALGHAPASPTAMLGFDTMYLIADAIERAGSADPERVSQSLADTRGFEGVSGTLTYPEDRRVPEKPIAIIEIEQGEEVIVAVFD